MVKNNPLVSAIIPTYNRAQIVCEAVDSALGQTYPQIEIIVVDDGSKDDTLARLKQYGDRIRIVSQANTGPSAARNCGIAASRGDLIAFLDSDDIWLPTKLERQVALLNKVGASVPCCLCNIMMEWRAGHRSSFEIALLKPSVDEGVWTNVDEVLATRPVLLNQGIIIRKEIIERTGGFDETLRILEDRELALRLSLEGSWGFIREPLVIWRESTGSLYHTAQMQEICSREIEVLERHLAQIENDDRYGSARKHVRAALNSARRQLWAMKMIKASSFGSAALGRAILGVEKYRAGIFRRSPWFPKMKVVQADSWTNAYVNHAAPVVLDPHTHSNEPA